MWKTRTSPAGPAMPEAEQVKTPAKDLAPILDTEGNSVASDRFSYLSGD